MSLNPENPDGQRVPLNKHHLTQFIKAFQAKENSRYAYNRATAGEAAPSWIYSAALVELIVGQIEKNPRCFEVLKQRG